MNKCLKYHNLLFQNESMTTMMPDTCTLNTRIAQKRIKILISIVVLLWLVLACNHYFVVLLIICFCTGHFVMVPLNIVWNIFLWTSLQFINVLACIWIQLKYNRGFLYNFVICDLFILQQIGHSSCFYLWCPRMSFY